MVFALLHPFLTSTIRTVEDTYLQLYKINKLTSGKDYSLHHHKYIYYLSIIMKHSLPEMPFPLLFCQLRAERKSETGARQPWR